MTLEELKSRQDVPVVVADEAGLIVSVNASFEAVFGWTPTEAVGSALTMVIPPRLRDAHNLGFSRFIRGGATTIVGRPLRLPAVDKAGREFEAEHLILAERRGDRWTIVASMTPIEAPPAGRDG